MRRIHYILLTGAFLLGSFYYPVDIQGQRSVSAPNSNRENSNSSSHRTSTNNKYSGQPSSTGVKRPGFSYNQANSSSSQSNQEINQRPIQNVESPGKINNFNNNTSISQGNGRRPGDNGNGNGNNNGNRPGNSNNNGNGVSKPGNGNSSNNGNNGYRPGNNNNNNNNGVNRPNSGNRPNNGNNSNNNRPNNGYRPNNSGPNYWPGSNNRPNNGYRPNNSSPRPNLNHSYHYGHYCPPPVRPYRPIYRPIYRPVLPPGYRPYYNAPIINNILGLTFGMTYVASLDYLFNKGYEVDGYNANTVYLRDVRQMMFVWDDATLNYSSSGFLDSMQFVNSTSYDDTSRYDKLYNEFCQQYGSPVSVSNTQRGMQASWYGRDSQSYITLEYQASYSSSNYLRYYTSLYYGY